MMSIIWTAMIVISVLFSFHTGTVSTVVSGMFAGANDAVQLCISIGGIICAWSGIMAVVEKSGMMVTLSKITNPLFRLLYPSAAHNRETLSALTGNFAANFLGIGNAATPFGIKAADSIIRNGNTDTTREISTLIVMNTASVQLIPTTICAARAANSSQNPFDILPAVWITSIISLAVGLCTVRMLTKRR